MNASQSDFVSVVKTYYKKHGRHTLPWRLTHDPYRVLVSEIMLQQTQVDRVIPKYEAFLIQFPTVEKLAIASLADVLQVWQGLGYNRRAKFLHQCAQVVTKEYSGGFPKTHEELQQLPGIGHYTAGAVMAFAYNLPIPIIETNIRAAYLHHFFPNQVAVEDQEIVRYIVLTLDQDNPRDWYAALMSYGKHLKQTLPNPSRRSKSHAKQSKFIGSDRQIRGAIVRALGAGSCTVRALCKQLSEFDSNRIETQLTKLQSEEMIQKNRQTYSLPG